MNTKINKRTVFALSMVILIVLTACGTLQIDTEPTVSLIEPAATPAEIAQPAPTQAIEESDIATAEPVTSEVVAEATAEPLALVGYSNKETGISFNYPTNWAMEEEANAFIFRNGTMILRVGYRMPGETADIWGRTGMPGGKVELLEGTVPFLGQSLAKHGLFYEGDLLILLSFGGEPGATVQSGAMEFTIILDNPETDYQTLDIPEEVLTEAELILASFGVGSTQGGPFGELQFYENPDYGFVLSYPPTWTVAEVNDVDFVGPGSRSVQLSQGTVKLVIGYRRAGENVAIGGSGAPGGEFDIRGTVQVAGQDVERYVIVFEGKDKVVMYGQPGPPPIMAGGLEFALRMDDFNPDYDSVELSQSVQDEADMIVSSLAIIEVEGSSAESKEFDSADETAESTPTDWKEFSNEAVGYWLMVPAEAEIVALDPSWRVFFIGPEVNGKPQFQFSVEHYDSNLPEGTDLFQQVIEDYHSYLKSVGRSDEGEVEELLIAGEPAIRTRYPGTIEADQPRDDFVFVHGDKIFQISITLFDSIDDEILNDQFLQSITFEPF